MNKLELKFERNMRGWRRRTNYNKNQMRFFMWKSQFYHCRRKKANYGK